MYNNGKRKERTDVVGQQVGVVVLDAVVEDCDDHTLAGVAQLPRTHHVHIHPAVSAAVLSNNNFSSLATFRNTHTRLTALFPGLPR